MKNRNSSIYSEIKKLAKYLILAEATLFISALDRIFEVQLKN